MPYQFNPLTGNFDLVNPQLTGAEIKTLYEGEDNTNAFTDAEKSKLTGLDSANYATAEQGVKADNSVQLTGSQTVTGTKTFTSPLILPNNSRINGVEHFYQSTKPVTRGDGSALVVGDRWYDSSTGDDWFWNGTYWLSQEVKKQQNIIDSVNLANFGSSFFNITEPIFLIRSGVESFYTAGLAATLNWSLTDNFTVVTDRPHAGVLATKVINSTVDVIAGASTHRNFSIAFDNLNTYIPYSTSGRVVSIRGSARTGSPTTTASSQNYSQQAYFIYRTVKL